MHCFKRKQLALTVANRSRTLSAWRPRTLCAKSISLHCSKWPGIGSPCLGCRAPLYRPKRGSSGPRRLRGWQGNLNEHCKILLQIEIFGSFSSLKLNFFKKSSTLTSVVRPNRVHFHIGAVGWHKVLINEWASLANSRLRRVYAAAAADFTEKPLTSATSRRWIIDVNVVILGRHRFLEKWEKNWWVYRRSFQSINRIFSYSEANPNFQFWGFC